MALSNSYVGQPDEATPNDSQYDIDDIYEKLDEMNGNLQLIYRKDNTVNVSVPDSATSTDAELASLSDAVSDIKESNDNLYQWVVILAFIIVILECKKMFRGAIKKYME